MRTLHEIEAKVLMVIGSSRGPVHPISIARRTGIKLADVEQACERAAQTRIGEIHGQSVCLAYLIDNSYYGHYSTVCRYIMSCNALQDAV